MATETVENYLKAIYTLAREPGSGAPAGAAGAATVTRVAAGLGGAPRTGAGGLRETVSY